MGCGLLPRRHYRPRSAPALTPRPQPREDQDREEGAGQQQRRRRRALAQRRGCCCRAVARRTSRTRAPPTSNPRRPAAPVHRRRAARPSPPPARGWRQTLRWPRGLAHTGSRRPRAPNEQASKTIIENYYSRLTLDFATNKRVADEVAVIPTKRLRNKIAGFTTHVMKRIQRGPVRGISLKCAPSRRRAPQPPPSGSHTLLVISLRI